MSNVSRMPLASPPPNERKAEALAEIQQLYAAYEDVVSENEQQDRVILRMQDRIAMLEEDLRNEKQRASICERKLIRLAANQRNISRIAQDGDEIMRSVQEWNETSEANDDGEARTILERVEPAAEPGTVPPVVTI
jgi:predicted RNase H-like nuclease (RuvC/YqgF family)